MPAALDGLKPFKILNIFSGDVSLKVENSSLLALRYSHSRMQF